MLAGASKACAGLATNAPEQLHPPGGVVRIWAIDRCDCLVGRMAATQTKRRRALARVLDALAAGERTAHDCAARQAVICTDPALCQFFRMQSRQEAVHAAVFAGAAYLFAPGTPPAGPLRPLLAEYTHRLEADLQARRLADSLVGMQVVLEGIGAVVLGELDSALCERGDAHAPLCRRLVAQEQAHRTGGARALRRLVREGTTELHALRPVAQEYLDLGLRLLHGAGDLLEAFNIDLPQRAQYADSLTGCVRDALAPSWA